MLPCYTNCSFLFCVLFHRQARIASSTLIAPLLKTVNALTVKTTFPSFLVIRHQKADGIEVLKTEITETFHTLILNTLNTGWAEFLTIWSVQLIKFCRISCWPFQCHRAWKYPLKIHQKRSA